MGLPLVKPGAAGRLYLKSSYPFFNRPFPNSSYPDLNSHSRRFKPNGSRQTRAWGGEIRKFPARNGLQFFP